MPLIPCGFTAEEQRFRVAAATFAIKKHGIPLLLNRPGTALQIDGGWEGHRADLLRPAAGARQPARGLRDIDHHRAGVHGLIAAGFAARTMV
ncbi:hypothetical protein [Nocardia sp. NPDC059239]|uniref:hypothetical protein n=1 Tax=unclassified Nocardia TaxID=2637762 RepID=UPI00369F1066